MAEQAVREVNRRQKDVVESAQPALDGRLCCVLTRVLGEQADQFFLVGMQVAAHDELDQG